MRDAEGFAPPELKELQALRSPRLVPVLAIAVALAAVTVYVVPRGIAAQNQLAIADDPVLLADRTLDEKFNAQVATREINKALANKDADLANSFVELAEARHVALDTGLKKKVAAAVKEESSFQHAAQSFAYGFVAGEPNDAASLAGTTLGDLFVFGDIRDAVREGSRWALGEKVDKLILGLSCVGLAITAGTYATLGAESPARVGLSLAKAARKTGRLSADLAASVWRMLRGVVDWGRLKSTVKGMSVAKPARAIRAAREAVKLRRARGLIHLAGDVGTVRAKAGTRAALEGLALAQSPREMSRIARLAEKAGGRTRAILKVAGRAAIMLTVGALDLGVWVIGALFTLFAFVVSLKSTAERLTWRVLQHRKARRLRRQMERYAVLTV
jgi:hypothetical protein